MSQQTEKLAVVDPIWSAMRQEALQIAAAEPAMAAMVHHAVLAHDGFEAAYVIRGRAEIDIGGTISELHAGDSISYPARLPHRLRSIGKRPVKVLLIETKVAALQDRRPARHAPEKRAKRVGVAKPGQKSLASAPTAKPAKANPTTAEPSRHKSAARSRGPRAQRPY